MTSLVLAASVAGCSYLSMPTLQNRSPHRDVRVAARCSTGGGAPVADTIMAVLGGIGTAWALYVLVDESTHEYGEWDGSGYIVAGVVGIPSGAMLLGYGFSARYGHRHVRACKAERQKPLAPAHDGPPGRY
jgi:hypothetical protein